MDLQREQAHREVQKSPAYENLVIELRGIIQAQAEIIKKQEETIGLQAEEIKLLKKKLYGSSSERRSGSGGGKSESGSNPPSSGKKTRQRSLTEQYPDAEIEEQRIGFNLSLQ